MEEMRDRRKYDIFRHHAWAGLALLSIFLAVRYFIPFPDWISLPVVFSLVLYSLVALVFTYKYSSALSAEGPHPSRSGEVEKERLKLEKKKIKAELKAMKKGRK